MRADGTAPGNVTNSSGDRIRCSRGRLTASQIAFTSDGGDGNSGDLPAERRGVRDRRRDLTNDPRPTRSRLVAGRGQARLLQRPLAERVRLGLDDGCGRRRRTRWTSPTRRSSTPTPPGRPDGTRIAFVRDAGGQNFNVWTALADGTEQVNLTRHRRPELVPRLGADPDGTDVRRDLDLGAGELGSGRRLRGDRGHLARRDPRRDGHDRGRSARRHPAWRHPPGRYPSGRHPARRHPARRHRLHRQRT